MAFFVEISLRERKYSASINAAPEFFVGKKVSFLGNFGLMNTTSLPLERYNPDNYVANYGYWAYFINPISMCESSGSFHCLNTYDRAYFTFGFLQYAAHVADGDFVKFFRKLLSTPLAEDYFPDLELKNNNIYRVSAGVRTQLEDSASTKKLMNYLNPSLSEVEEVEVINSAKFIHWSKDTQHTEIQVECGINHIKEAMKGYSRRYNLDGRSDKVCLVVADIRHQGRGKSTEIINALNTSSDEKAYTNLLEIGEPVFSGRIKTLRDTIKAMVSTGKFGSKKYNQAKNDFV